MPSHPSQTFAAVKARYLIAGFFVTTLIAIIAYIIIVPDDGQVTEVPITDAILGFAYSAMICVIPLLICWRKGLLRDFSLGEWPSAKQVRLYLSLGAPMVGIAIFAFFLVYLPLSYVAPDFVTAWALDDPRLIWWQGNTDTLIASGINIVTMVIVAPVVEELFFRGFLLNRLWHKYGFGAGAVLSSIAFAIGHVEMLGAMVFGIVLSVIYARTGSLIGPILVHMANNAIVVMLMLTEGALTGDIANWTLDGFRSDWWLAVAGAIVGVPWLAWYCWMHLRAETHPQPVEAVTEPE